MRELTSHQVGGLNEVLQILVCDEPGSGGANHHYQIKEYGPAGSVFCDIKFQNGPIQEAGVNGISNEALLSIVEDRLVGFQSGQYACDDNYCALEHIRVAMNFLQQRTKARLARGVEGTHQV